MKIAEARKALSEYAKDVIDTCPHCGALSHIEAQWNECHVHRNGDVDFYVVFRCKPCQKLILKTFSLEQNKYRDEQDLSIVGWKLAFPISLDDQLNNEEKEYVPGEVLKDYEEALQCQSIGALRASCSMFRRALQASLLQIGADPKFDLVKQIESVGSLPSDVKDWAHQIRIFGNWAAHPDKDNLKEVSKSDVSEAHDFMSKFLLYVFIMPEKVKQSRQRREQAAAKNPAGNGKK